MISAQNKRFTVKLMLHFSDKCIAILLDAIEFLKPKSNIKGYILLCL